MIQYSQKCLKGIWEKGCELAASTSKKVVVRRFDREPLAGFVNPRTYQLADGIELLTQAGTVQVLPYEEVKAVCFVRDFEAAPSEAGQRVFLSRPKTDGLWVRMKFRDGEVMDGLLPNDLLRTERAGFTIVPPNPSSNNQRIFVPRSALVESQVLGVVGSPLKPRKAKPVPKTQMEMFE